jgi:hypothetical protein
MIYAIKNNCNYNIFEYIALHLHVDTENLEVTYTNINSTVIKSSFVMLSCHISINLRFLPMNENCEFHVRDLDCRLSLTDKNIINKFNNPKYQYVPYYVFQFYELLEYN